jgi:D-alanyl-D-alanine carboxypeptidase (penicillin-binding protein 5/6)
MTAMYVVENLKMDDRVEVSPYAAAAPASKINIRPGDVYTVKELLYALLLSSANDGARALAEQTSGSEETFARKLTQQVRQWGAYRTTLANANGLPSENQYSTAQDLAVLFRRAMENPELAKIMGAKYYEIQGDRELRNHNRFLFTTPLAVAGKTGFTRSSKHTYVGQFRKDDAEIIISLMGSSKKWAAPPLPKWNLRRNGSGLPKNMPGVMPGPLPARVSSRGGARRSWVPPAPCPAKKRLARKRMPMDRNPRCRNRPLIF